MKWCCGYLIPQRFILYRFPLSPVASRRRLVTFFPIVKEQRLIPRLPVIMCGVGGSPCADCFGVSTYRRKVWLVLHCLALLWRSIAGFFRLSIVNHDFLLIG